MLLICLKIWYSWLDRIFNITKDINPLKSKDLQYIGGFKINNTKNEWALGYFPAFLPFGDVFQIFIAIVAVIVLFLGISAIRKKKQASDKMNRRVSSLRREFNSVKQDSSNEEDDWIEKRLEDDDDFIYELQNR